MMGSKMGSRMVSAKKSTMGQSGMRQSVQGKISSTKMGGGMAANTGGS